MVASRPWIDASHYKARKLKEVSAVRFNAIAGYARQPMSQVIGEEVSYFQNDDGSLMGMIIRDRADNDFSGILFGQDKKLRFRWTGMTEFLPSVTDAVLALEQKFLDMETAPAEEHHQGDEVGEPIDFFTPLHTEDRLHPDFLSLINGEEFSPAREIIGPMMRWYEDADGNFVEQFQSTGFDQRIWELYLFATLIELGYVIDREVAVPDFCCAGLRGQMAIEAATVGPTRQGGEIIAPPPRDTLEQQRAYLEHYMPIKFGSPLFSKLRKEYWKQEHVSGIPFVLAVADFSSPGSMVYSSSALERYLYGYEFEPVENEDGTTKVTARKIEQHTWGDKSIPSGFFDIPEAENVSAVISTSAGTVSKFNRIGLTAGFGSGKVFMIREGMLTDHDPEAVYPLYFKSVVNAPGYSEPWSQGLNVYHNPRARISLPEHMFENAAHHYCDADGNWASNTPEFHPISSVTRILAPVDVQAALEAVGDQLFRVWKKQQ